MAYLVLVLTMLHLPLGSMVSASETNTLANLPALAAALESRGEHEKAARILQQALAADPEDASSWVLLARIRRAAGDIDGALRAARAANRTAYTDEERFAAATELAAGNIRLERGLLAQFWLRRAIEVAPTERLRTEAVRAFRLVRAETPWSASLRFSVAPSSNVNNGSNAETIEIAELPFVLSGDARALSGVEYTLSGSARYRFDGIQGLPASFRLGVGLRRVTLSDEAKRQAPDASGSDYAYDAIEVGVSQLLTRTDDRRQVRLDGLFGYNRYGGEPFSTYTRATLVTQWPADARSLWTISGSLERQSRKSLAERSAWITRAEVSRFWQIGDRGDALSLSFGLRNVSSQAEEIDHKAALINIGYKSGPPVLGPFTLATQLRIEQRDYASSPYSASGRQDTRGGLSVTLGRPDLGYYGFTPTVTFEASRTYSNVSLYDSTDYGIRLGIVSTF